MLFTKMKAKQCGFTVLEMMLAVAILAVLVSFGLPNFRDFIRNARMAAAANDLLADMNLARSEAIKRRVPVTLCKSQDAATCDASSTSQFRGWIVYVDDADATEETTDDGDGTVDSGEVVLRSSVISPDIDSAIGEGNFSTFVSSGFIRPSADLEYVLFCDSRGNTVTSGGDSAARAITITATGRAALTRNIDIIEDEPFDGCPL